MTSEQLPLLEALVIFLGEIERDLRKDLDLAGLHSRNPVAHKWKAPMRCWVLRECVARRSRELLLQALELEIGGHLLASRILARSAIETLAVLAYSNYSMTQVAAGALDFKEFSLRTQVLLAGSKNRTTPYEAVGILKMIDRLDNDFAGVRNIYDHLSEYVHPNYEGLAKAYSQPVRSEDRIVFLSNMRPVVDDTIPAIVKICTHILTTNYNERFELPPENRTVTAATI